MSQNYVRYIPPVDTPPYATYMGCYRVSPPPVSTVPDILSASNRMCPVNICSQCAGPNCKCNMSHMKDPFKKRYFVYKWNQY